MKWFCKYWLLKHEMVVLELKYENLEKKYKDLLQQVDDDIWEELDE